MIYVFRFGFIQPQKNQECHISKIKLFFDACVSFFHFLYLLTLFLSFLTVKVMALSLTGVKVSDGLIAHWGHHTILYDTIRYHTIPYNAIQCHTIPHSTTQYYRIPHITIWYHVIAFYSVFGWSDSSLRTHRPMLAINLWVAPRVHAAFFTSNHIGQNSYRRRQNKEVEAREWGGWRCWGVEFCCT